MSEDYLSKTTTAHRQQLEESLKHTHTDAERPDLNGRDVGIRLDPHMPIRFQTRRADQFRRWTDSWTIPLYGSTDCRHLNTSIKPYVDGCIPFTTTTTGPSIIWGWVGRMWKCEPMMQDYCTVSFRQHEERSFTTVLRLIANFRISDSNTESWEKIGYGERSRTGNESLCRMLPAPYFYTLPLRLTKCALGFHYCL